MADANLQDEIRTPARRGRRWWLILMTLPYFALCFPQIYARTTPTLWGFPFFYWYQLMWVLIASALLGVVYKMGNKE